MKLNCDLGESFGAWTMPVDSAMMALIDQANIACGFHAGDPLVMKNALARAKAHNITIGAHPSYPDLQGFGRRSMQLPASELSALIQYQVSALAGMASLFDLPLSYVKPHGALYNDMMKNSDLRHVVMQSIAEFDTSLKLMVQATNQNETLQKEADSYSISLLFEAFADRRYTDEGLLTSRTLQGAVLTETEAFEQAKQLIECGTVTSSTGRTIPVEADTLCVHGDTQGAVEITRQIRQLLS